MARSSRFIDANGTETWYLSGELHRDDGPAVTIGDGHSLQWYQYGRRHRDDGPAIEYGSGNKSWYRYGQRHRIDGPAIDRIDGVKFWYIYNIEFESASIYVAHLLKQKLITMEDAILIKMQN